MDLVYYKITNVTAKCIHYNEHIKKVRVILLPYVTIFDDIYKYNNVTSLVHRFVKLVNSSHGLQDYSLVNFSVTVNMTL